MPVRAVFGANWGDEGKGKITDHLALDAKYVARFQGGKNAGRTVINDYGKFQLHLLPSGVFYPHVTKSLEARFAVNLSILFQELDDPIERGVPHPRLAVSDRAQLVLPLHTMLDRLENDCLGDRSFGSTRVGIAPFYADKALKIGVQVHELFHADFLEARIVRSLETKQTLLEHLHGSEPVHPEAVFAEMSPLVSRLEPFVCDVDEMLANALSTKIHILPEGQLGALRDPDHGIYPFPVSSSPLAGFGAVGAGSPPYEIRGIVAVTKAYSSCVGAGPFVTASGASKRTSSERAAAMPENTGPPPAVPDGLAGSMPWPPDTVAACRAPLRWHLRT